MSNIADLISETRKECGLTQEETAARGTFNADMLSRIECGKMENLPQDIQASIITALNSKKLAFKLSQECPVWKMILPQIEDMTLSESACSVLSGLTRLQNRTLQILDIVKNNKIDEHEEETHQEVKKDALQLIAALMAFLAADGEFDGKLIKELEK
jgi:transcriptional regulator with XRE-family HTH domain